MSVSSDPAVTTRAEPDWPTEAGIATPRPGVASGVTSPTPGSGGSPSTSAANGTAAAGDSARASQPIGRLRRVDPVELWRSADFAAWLAHNLDEVARLVDLRLVAGENGAAAPGTVVATDASGAPVRIVVELGASTDETFGVLMRQIVASGAKTAIWVCARAREEHLASVEWLNREIDGQVHVVSVDAVRIDDSPPAPILALALRAGGRAGAAGSASAPPKPATNGTVTPAAG